MSANQESVTDLILLLECGFNPDYFSAKQRSYLDLVLGSSWRRLYVKGEAA